MSIDSAKGGGVEEARRPVGGKMSLGTSPEGRSLARRSVIGLIAVIVQSVLGRASLLIGQLVLARLLLPTDFGQVALASIISSIASAVVSFGIDQVLQQRKRAARLWFTQILVISLAAAVIGGALMILFGLLGGQIYHSAELPSLVALIAAGLPILSLATVPQVALQAELRFKFLAAYATFDAVLTQVLIILCAWWGWGAYSFFAPLLLTYAMKAAAFWGVSRSRLRPLRRSRGWSLMMRRGLATFGTRVSMVAITQGDFLVLGFFAPVSVVGVYFFAFRLASQPMMILSGSISSVLFSSLLRVSSRDQRARIAFFTAEMVGAVTVPVSLMVALVAPVAVVMFFGERWKAAVPLVQILSLGLGFDAIAWPAAALLTADGEFRRSFHYQTWTVPIFFGSAALGGALASAVGLATGISCYYVLHPFLYCLMTFRRSDVGAGAVVGLFWRLALCAALAFAPLYALSLAPFMTARPVTALALEVLVGPAAWVLVLRTVARDIFETAIKEGRALVSSGERSSSA